MKRDQFGRPKLRGVVGSTEEPKGKGRQSRKGRRGKDDGPEPARELFIVVGKSKTGRIRRVYPTRPEAELDAARSRRRGAEVEVISSKEK